MVIQGSGELGYLETCPPVYSLMPSPSHRFDEHSDFLPSLVGTDTLLVISCWYASSFDSLKRICCIKYKTLTSLLVGDCSLDKSPKISRHGSVQLVIVDIISNKRIIRQPFLNVIQEMFSCAWKGFQYVWRLTQSCIKVLVAVVSILDSAGHVI